VVETMSDVFVLIACAVYDQGIYGVFSNGGAAVAHGETLWDESDGHHQFRVERWSVGQAREADRTIYGWMPEEIRRERMDARDEKWERPVIPVVNGGDDEAMSEA
jgi:hypothetical protein